MAKSKLPPRLSLTKFAEATKGTGGIITAICKRLGYSRNRVYEFMREHPEETEKILFQEREALKDGAEGQLFQKAMSGEEWAVKFFLRYKAQDRGYKEEVEVNHTHQPLQVEFTFRPPTEFIPHKNPALLEDDDKKTRTINDE